MAVTITAKRNGPYGVEANDGAEIKVVDADGKPFDLKGKTAFSLCRCGHSAKTSQFMMEPTARSASNPMTSCRGRKAPNNRR